MMPELHELYQELILDHNRRPRNRRTIEAPDCSAKGHNPLCGDHVTVYVKLKNDFVRDVTFEGSGCAISTASASLMTEALKGKTLDDAKAIFRKFHRLATGQANEIEEGPGLGKLEVFSNICRYPARVKCATLVWHTVNAALEKRKVPVSTE